MAVRLATIAPSNMNTFTPICNVATEVEREPVTRVKC
jgi:hypothetical protein